MRVANQADHLATRLGASRACVRLVAASLLAQRLCDCQAVETQRLAKGTSRTEMATHRCIDIQTHDIANLERTNTFSISYESGPRGGWEREWGSNKPRYAEIQKYGGEGRATPDFRNRESGGGEGHNPRFPKSEKKGADKSRSYKPMLYVSGRDRARQGQTVGDQPPGLHNK